MKRVQYLLGKLAEEAAEIAQIALKTQQFGMLEVYPGNKFALTNAEHIHGELNDLLGVVKMLNEEFSFGFTPDPAAIEAKRLKVNRYAEYSKSLGELQDEILDKKEISDL